MGNPYDGHTLDAQLAQVRLLVTTHAVKEGPVDMGYRINNHQSLETIIVYKRRAAIEPTIGNLKAEHRVERNRRKGTQGNAINALLRAAAMNFQKLLGFFLYRLLHILHSLFPSGIPGSVFGGDVVRCLFQGRLVKGCYRQFLAPRSGYTHFVAGAGA